YRNLMLKGFVLNFANPMVIFYWFTVMTLAEKNTSDNSTPVLFFISILLGTFIVFDVLKMVGAKKLRPLMTPRILKSLNQLIGIVFVGFGLFLLIKGIIAL
ncbi:MAG: LysE family translocator, partial [Bacteroidetes bacterium]|nr:LysE family translocator [Bacteroidota bacterium]